MPRSHSGVTLDDNAMEVRNEENVRDEKNTKESTQNNTDGSTCAELFQRWSGRCLDGDEKRKNSSGEGKIDRNSPKSLLK